MDAVQHLRALFSPSRPPPTLHGTSADGDRTTPPAQRSLQPDEASGSSDHASHTPSAGEATCGIGDAAASDASVKPSAEQTFTLAASKRIPPGAPETGPVVLNELTSLFHFVEAKPATTLGPRAPISEILSAPPTQPSLTTVISRSEPAQDTAPTHNSDESDDAFDAAALDLPTTKQSLPAQQPVPPPRGTPQPSVPATPLSVLKGKPRAPPRTRSLSHLDEAARWALQADPVAFQLCTDKLCVVCDEKPQVVCLNTRCNNDHFLSRVSSIAVVKMHLLCHKRRALREKLHAIPDEFQLCSKPGCSVCGATKRFVCTVCDDHCFAANAGPKSLAQHLLSSAHLSKAQASQDSAQDDHNVALWASTKHPDFYQVCGREGDPCGAGCPRCGGAGVICRHCEDGAPFFRGCTDLSASLLVLHRLHHMHSSMAALSTATAEALPAELELCSDVGCVRCLTSPQLVCRLCSGNVHFSSRGNLFNHLASTKHRRSTLRAHVASQQMNNKHQSPPAPPAAVASPSATRTPPLTDDDAHDGREGGAGETSAGKRPRPATFGIGHAVIAAASGNHGTAFSVRFARVLARTMLRCQEPLPKDFVDVFTAAAKEERMPMCHALPADEEVARQLRYMQRAEQRSVDDSDDSDDSLMSDDSEATAWLYGGD